MFGEVDRRGAPVQIAAYSLSAIWRMVARLSSTIDHETVDADASRRYGTPRRCGRVRAVSSSRKAPVAVEPPAGFCSVEALRTLAKGFGIKANGDVASELDSVVAKGLGKLVCHYWNKGEAREGGRGKLVAPGGGIKAGAIDPPLTHSGKYRKEIREVGTDRFRVRQ